MLTVHQFPEQDAEESSVHASHPDFRELYCYSKNKKSGSTRSLSSFTTDRSSATCVASNTSKAKERKKHQKRKFRAFANWLMRFLEKKDPRVYGEAQAVIRDCEQRKKRGEAGYESVTESLKEPLREVVGTSYWREAQYHLDQFMLVNKHSIADYSSTMSFGHDHASTVALSRSDSSSTATSHSQHAMPKPTPRARADLSPLSTKSNWNLLDEKRIRRERFYMLLRLLMKYLELSNRPLYLRAKNAIDDCIARNEKREEGYESLSESIKRTVKQVVGDTNWRKAESYLSKAILQQAHNEAMEECWSREAFPIEPLNAEEAVITHGSANHDDESQGIGTEFFVNVCQAFGSSAKRTMEEQAMMISATATSLCLKNSDSNDPELGSASFERKRRRLQTSQEGRLRT